MENNDYNKALNYINMLLAKRLFSKNILKKKLKFKKFSDKIIDKILFNLEDAKVIDDYNYACQLCYLAIEKCKGIKWLKQRAIKDGISESYLNKSLKDLAINWYDVASRALELYRKKQKLKQDANNTFIDSDYIRKTKEYRFLQAKGFDSDIIAKLV